MKRTTTSGPSFVGSPTRRTAIVGAATLATAAGLAGCGSGGAEKESDEKVTSLTVLDYYNQGKNESVIGAMLEKCGKELGVTIERTKVPGAGLIQKVLQQASSKTLPDVLMLDNPDLQQIAATGALSPLSDYDISSDGFAEGVVSAGTYEGKLYGLAPTVNTIGVFYDKKMLADAGVQPPTTWEELQTAAKSLTQGDRYGLAFAAPATYEGTWTFMPFMWSNGGDETSIDDSGTVGALELWTELVKSGAVSQSVVTWSQADVKDQFLAGKAAMMVNGPWQIPALKEAGADFGIATIPVPEAGDTAVAPLGGEVWTVPRTSSTAKMKVAAKLVELLNSEENQLSMAKDRFTIPSRTEVAKKLQTEVPEQEVFVTLVADARARTGELGTEWPETATQLYTAIQSALTEQASPADALKSAAKG